MGWGEKPGAIHSDLPNTSHKSKTCIRTFCIESELIAITWALVPAIESILNVYTDSQMCMT